MFFFNPTLSIQSFLSGGAVITGCSGSHRHRIKVQLRQGNRRRGVGGGRVCPLMLLSAGPSLRCATFTCLAALTARLRQHRTDNAPVLTGAASPGLSGADARTIARGWSCVHPGAQSSLCGSGQGKENQRLRTGAGMVPPSGPSALKKEKRF